MSRQWRSDDTNKWGDGFGNGSSGNLSYAGNLGGQNGYGVATFSGTSGNYSGTFSDTAYFNGSNGGRIGDIVLIHQSRNGGSGAGNWELNVITNRSGSTVSLKYPLQNNYGTTAQIVSSANWNEITLNSGTTVGFLGWNGSAGGIIFLMAKTSITVNGTLSVSAAGFRGGTGAFSQGQANCGEGTGGASVATRNANGNGGGGGQGDDSSGGGGGHASSGENGTRGNFGIGGSSAGNAGLTSMVFGGGGGGASEYNPSGSVPTGGTGAGIVVLIAPKIIINGSISLAPTNGSTGDNVASGSGSGGSCLIKAKEATLGSNLITAPAGARVAGWGGVLGGGGSVGRIHLDYSVSYTGTTSPTLDVRQDLSIVEPASFLMMF